jgi:hypothetical protein
MEDKEAKTGYSIQEDCCLLGLPPPVVDGAIGCFTLRYPVGVFHCAANHALLNLIHHAFSLPQFLVPIKQIAVRRSFVVFKL